MVVLGDGGGDGLVRDVGEGRNVWDAQLLELNEDERVVR